jgi:hypothetical protein
LRCRLGDPDRGSRTDNSGGLNAALLNSLQSDRQADRRKHVSDASAQVKSIIVDGKVDELARFVWVVTHGPLSLLDVGQGRRLLEV